MKWKNLQYCLCEMADALKNKDRSGVKIDNLYNLESVGREVSGNAPWSQELIVLMAHS